MGKGMGVGVFMSVLSLSEIPRKGGNLKLLHMYFKKFAKCDNVAHVFHVNLIL